MTDDRADFHARLSATSASVAEARTLVRGWVARSAPATNGQVADIGLCVSEAAANVVLHAYPDHNRDRGFDIDGHLEPHRVTIMISDTGVGPHHPSPNAGLGQGLHLIEHVSTCWRIQDTHPGTRVTIRFQLDSPTS